MDQMKLQATSTSLIPTMETEMSNASVKNVTYDVAFPSTPITLGTMQDEFNSSTTEVFNATVTTMADLSKTTYGMLYTKTMDSAELFHYYATPCVALIGIICNILALAVLIGTKLRKSSAGHYLIALAIADSVELLAEFVKWINRLSGIVDGSAVLCKIVNHVRYSGQLWSAVLTTSITIERYVVVAWPLRASTLITTTKTKIIILFELMTCLTLGAYGSIFFDIIKFSSDSFGICLLDFTKSEAYSYCNLIISKVFGEVFTNALVLVFTGLIIKNLLTAIKFRRQDSDSQIARNGPGSEKQMTFMLVMVATAFVLLRSPYTITWYYSHYRWDVRSVDIILNQALNVTYVLYMINHAINFLLYNLSGSTFRGHLVSLLCPCKIRIRKFGTEISTLTSRVTAAEKAAEEDEVPMSPRSEHRSLDSNANSRIPSKDDPEVEDNRDDKSEHLSEK